jgi:cytochrome bd-type quinol oxidase subunit 2
MKSPKLKGGDMAETAYTATATFGRVVAFFQMLAGIVFGIIFVLVGVAIFRAKPQDTQKEKSNNNVIGVIFILIGLLAFFGSIGWFILTLKYKAVAAGTGLFTAVGWTADAVVN